MTDTHCTSCEYTSPKKAVCPVNGQTYAQIAMKTVLHHITKPWQRQLAEQGYYFCDDPDCKVVYFGEDETLFTVADVRTTVGLKSNKADRPICYCFDVTQRDLESQLETCRHFIIEKTKTKTCDCEIRNPAGRCCLRDLPGKQTE